MSVLMKKKSAIMTQNVMTAFFIFLYIYSRLDKTSNYTHDIVVSMDSSS